MFRNNDMPITTRPRAVVQITSQAPSLPSVPSSVGRHTAHWAVATAKRVYPAALILTICTAALAATIALRLTIWLPMHLH
jgi:hypothetical protein